MSRAMDLGSVAEFLNTLDERTFGAHREKPAAARDELASPLALAAWLTAREVALPDVALSDRDLRLAIRLRDGLRRLLATGEAGGVNALARELPLVVRFTPAGPAPEPATADEPVASFAAELLAACALAVARGEWPLLKMCAAPDCRWVFVDRSRNHLGRWCATAVCGNRVKTRTYRARRHP